MTRSTTPLKVLNVPIMLVERVFMVRLKFANKCSSIFLTLIFSAIIIHDNILVEIMATYMTGRVTLLTKLRDL